MISSTKLSDPTVLFSTVFEVPPLADVFRIFEYASQ